MEGVAERVRHADAKTSASLIRLNTVLVNESHSYYSAPSFDVALNLRRAILSQTTIAQVHQRERPFQMTSARTSTTGKEQANLLTSLQPLVGACLLGAVLVGTFSGSFADPDLSRLIGAGIAALAYLAWRILR